MSNPNVSNEEHDSEKFLYKIKKWGELQPDVYFVLYTNHDTEDDSTPLFNITILAVVSSCLDFTRKLDWINYFGSTVSYLLRHESESQIIEVDYKNGPKVKFILFDSGDDHKMNALPHSKILVNKN